MDKNQNNIPDFYEQKMYTNQQIIQQQQQQQQQVPRQQMNINKIPNYMYQNYKQNPYINPNVYGINTPNYYGQQKNRNIGCLLGVVIILLIIIAGAILLKIEMEG